MSDNLEIPYVPMVKIDPPAQTSLTFKATPLDHEHQWEASTGYLLIPQDRPAQSDWPYPILAKGDRVEIERLNVERCTVGGCPSWRTRP